MAGLWLALGLLSRLPAPVVAFEPGNLRRALFWFPAVGVVLGVVLVTTASAASAFFGAWTTAFLILCAWVLFTGGLHLDGVADSFDGLSASGGGRERALKAMKDSRIGAHGAVAIMGVLLGKLVALGELAGSPHGGVWALLFTPVWARIVVAVAMVHSSPAAGSTLAALFHSAVRPREAWLGTLWLTLPLLALTYAAPAGSALRTLTPALGGLLVGLGFVLVCRRRFGGVTGDTHGALIELGELVTLLLWGAHV